MYIFKEISHRRVHFFQKEAQMRKLSHDVTLSQLLYPPPTHLSVNLLPFSFL